MLKDIHAEELNIYQELSDEAAQNLNGGCRRYNNQDNESDDDSPRNNGYHKRPRRFLYKTNITRFSQLIAAR